MNNIELYYWLFIRLLFHPKLLITDLRVNHRGYFALAAAFLSVATLTMGNTLVFGSRSGVGAWLAAATLSLTAFLFFALAYLPLVHLFGERHMPESRVTDLLVYAGFSLAPLLLLLPAAFLALLLPAGGVYFYVAALIAAGLKIFINLLTGIKENYQLGSKKRALGIFFAPLATFVLLLVVNVLLSAFVFSHG